jgi:hypothetical protein
MPVGEFSNITADSVPVLDGWGWDRYWGCNHWIIWHGAMVEKYGLKYANDRFMLYWNQQGFGASPLDCTTFNPQFIAYTKKAGLYRAFFGGLALLAYPIGVATELILDAGQIVDDVAESAKVLGSMLKWLVPVAVFGLGYWAFKNYIPQPKKLQR